jgi:hypothetical protein
VSELSLDLGAENPRLDGSIPLLGAMHSESFDLIGAFYACHFSTTVLFLPAIFNYQTALNFFHIKCLFY